MSRFVNFRSRQFPEPRPEDGHDSANQTSSNVEAKILPHARPNRPQASKFPNKQFLGGRFPPFLERIVQRIQNYFSVYNPPEYFENNRPPITPNDGISLICSNGENDSVSCNPAPEEEDCEQSSVAANQVSLNAAHPPPVGDDTGYNVLVTHTVVHDNMINVYSPSADPAGSQFVSNVVVILEPSPTESKTSVETTTPRNKFYVYVRPTKNKNNVDTKTSAESKEKPEPFQPYDNSSYTIFIRGDKLEEYSNNIENADNSSLNPDISMYVQNSTGTKFVKNKCNPHSRGDCESKPVLATVAGDSENTILNSRSVPEEKSPSSMSEIPNINLVLVPPDARKNKSCTKNKYDTADTNTNIEYYVLKPDDGSLNKPKQTKGMATNFYFLSKTKLDDISPTYLPPNEDDLAETYSATSSYIMPVHVNYTSTKKPPLLLNLFRRRHEEPR